MQKMLITKEQRDALIAYLADRPFKEVASAIAWLQQLPPLPAAVRQENQLEVNG